ncbi:hypothetical protein NT6N_09560 [Oceaniferula spumae]|uniref:Lipoprotein n=1 Tax=Oceaniferula spumae TaxID=2979115 RepID=A0AAT9FIM0_9BACT
MQSRLVIALLASLILSSCDSVFSPEGWPVTVTEQREAVNHMVEHVKFTGSTADLTKQEKVLLTFLDDPKNVEAAIGVKSRENSHQWSTAEVYLVEPGKHVSVLCENGLEQKPVYFHYNKGEKTWYRVGNLEEKHSKGVPAVIVK